MLNYESVKNLTCKQLVIKLKEIQLQAWQDLNAVDDPYARLIQDRDKMTRCINFLTNLIHRLELSPNRTVADYLRATRDTDDFSKKERTFILDISGWMNYAYT